MEKEEVSGRQREAGGRGKEGGEESKTHYYVTPR